MQVFDHRLLVAVPANKWIGEWIQRDPSPIYRGTLAAQLRLIRKRHGTPMRRGIVTTWHGWVATPQSMGCKQTYTSVQRFDANPYHIRTYDEFSAADLTQTLAA